MIKLKQSGHISAWSFYFKTNKMLVEELLKNDSRLILNVSMEDLKSFASILIEKTKRDLEEAVISAKAETYPSPKQVAEILDVDLSTLWRWSQRGYLVPVEVGGKRRYLMSEVKALLSKPNSKGRR
jgi:hypothetical protein